MDLSNENIRELLVKSQAGDKVAYDAFFIAILPLIKSMAKKKIFNQNDTEDMVQTILMNIHSSLHTYDKKRAPLSWIKAIAHYKIIDYIRKVTKLQERELITDDGDVTIYAAASNNHLEALEIVNALPESLREPLILTKIKGHDSKEAAEMMGIKENALRTRVSRAMKQIKKNLEKENYE